MIASGFFSHSHRRPSSLVFQVLVVKGDTLRPSMILDSDGIGKRSIENNNRALMGTTQ